MQTALDQLGEQHAGLEVGCDAQRLKARWQRAMGATAVKSSHQANLLLRLTGAEGGSWLFRKGGEMGHDPLKIAGRDRDVGVVDEKKTVAGVGGQLYQSADLPVGPKGCGTSDQLNGMGRKFLLQLFDSYRGGIGKRGNAKEQLKIAGIGLAAMAAEGFDHAWVKPLEGLEDADAGGKGFQRGTPVNHKDARGYHGRQIVAHSGYCQHSGDDLNDLG